uniref:Efflux RND transporter permease subunit n=1 Tax=Acidobacterium capsulatum TaxID=33075 RepID=A0A7V5CU51_9BACT
MPKFALKYPFFVLMICFISTLVGIVSLLSMPVDLFPKINIPVVVVATFYSGMPPQQIEGDITDTFERFFTYASNVDHIESRSMTGVSIIKVYFRPGTDPNAALSSISNLAMADLRRLPPGTLPPVVLGMDASDQPVCLVTLKGKGLNETQLKDIAQFTVRDQLASVQGASIPDPYGGTYRQIQVYVNPLKLEAHNLSLMDVVHAVNNSNLILPAGDVQIGTKDYNVYANAQFPSPKSINSLPLKSVGNGSVLVADVGKAEDAGAIQTNIVRIDGQRSVYLPIFKQGGDSNTITIVNGIRKTVKHLVDIPQTLKTAVVFDQSAFVKSAIVQLLREGGIGLLLTGLMILLFLGNARATIAVMLSVPLSVILCLLFTDIMGGSINTMLLGGLALALSRLIDNGVVVLENIFRYMEMGEPPRIAAEVGGTEVSLAVLAATVTTSIVFFPVASLTGVSKYIFTPLALGVVISMFASYVFAMTVVPLFCATFIRLDHHAHGNEEQAEAHRRKQSIFQRIVNTFNDYFQKLQDWYEGLAKRTMQRPGLTTVVILAGVILSIAVTLPFLGQAYFPRTDAGQFVINVKMPNGTRVEDSNNYIAKVETIIRQQIPKRDLGMIVSNIGITHGPSTIYSSNSSMDTAFVQVSLKEGHTLSSFAYMDRVRRALSQQMPELTTYFQGGGLVDAVINQGLPAPIVIQVKSNNMQGAYALAQKLAAKIRKMPNVASAYIPQNLDYPGIQLNIDREKASLIGLTTKQVMDNVITALTSDGQVAPSYWIDPKTGNNYMLTVQYYPKMIEHMSMQQFENIPLRAAKSNQYTPLQSVASVNIINTPTEVDHYQLRRVIDIYVATKTEALGKIGNRIKNLLKNTKTGKNTRLSVIGAVVYMKDAFFHFGVGLVLAVILVYLVLMAQFASFVDPFIILMAIPPGLAGVVITLVLTGSTLNLMSLMGTIMMTGIVVSNSILIVDFANILHRQGLPLLEAAVKSCKMRLRPILMTSLATLLGMIPMALGIEAGSEQYAPLARAIIGGLAVSVVVTMFVVPAVYLLIHAREEGKQMKGEVNA